jgi:hypothetical protein
MAYGSGNAISSATATSGAVDNSYPSPEPGNATATSSAMAYGSGGAKAAATAAEGFGDNGFANATANAETAEGGLAQAQAEADFYSGQSQSTAKTTFGGVSVQSTVESPYGGSTDATAQGGSGQSPVDTGQFDGGLAFSTALPNAAYATALIGSASNVADALLGPDDTIFGTAILGPGGSSTFDFNFRGDLILGDVSDNSIINLGSSLGPNIDLTLEDEGVFVLGGIAAAPEPSTWAMMLLGFAGLGYAGYRRTGAPRAAHRWPWIAASRSRAPRDDGRRAHEMFGGSSRPTVAGAYELGR